VAVCQGVLGVAGGGLVAVGAWPLARLDLEGVQALGAYHDQRSAGEPVVDHRPVADHQRDHVAAVFDRESGVMVRPL
jgi:hypothetical protein